MIDARMIERYAAGAWPAAEAREEEGWLLRHTPGVPRRRSNSALPLARGEALLTALPRVEDFYELPGRFGAPDRISGFAGCAVPPSR